MIGTGPSGQGHETGFAQVAGALLGVPVGNIEIIMGDTDIVSLGGGSHSGRSMRHSATLFAKAAPELVAKGKALAARLLDVGADRGGISRTDGFRRRRTTAASTSRLGREGARLGAKANWRWWTDDEMRDPVFPNGCTVCEVEIKPETGVVEIAGCTVVDDVGVASTR